MENAYIKYKGIKGTTLGVGYFDLPITLEESTSSNDTLFMERSSAVNIANLIAGGDFRAAVGGHWNGDRLWLGAYLTGPTSGVQHNIGALGGSAEQVAVAARAAYQVLQGPDYTVHVGVDIQDLITPPHAGGLRSITFSDRPELRIDPTSLLTTAAINNVSGAGAYSAELAGGYQNFFLQGEYFHY